MAALSPKRRQSAIIVITVVLLAVAFTAFFFIQVPARTEELKERKFRVLSKISENFRGGYDVLQTNADNQAEIIKNYFERLKALQSQEKEGEPQAAVEPGYSTISRPQEKRSQRSADAQTQKSYGAYVEQQVQRKAVKEWMQNLPEKSEAVSSQRIWTVKPKAAKKEKKETPLEQICREKKFSEYLQFWNDTLTRFNNRTHIRIFRLTCKGDTIINEPLKENEFKFATVTIKEDSAAMELVIVSDREEFFKPLLKKGSFDKYLVLDTAGEVVYNQLPTAVRIKQKDSLLKAEEVNSQLLAGVVKKVEIGGIQYQMLVQPFTLSGKNWWLLCGLTQVDNFASSSMHISTMGIIILLIIVSIGLLSIPFLKLLLISKNEQLRKYDISVAGLSLIMGIPILLLLLMQVYRYMIIDKRESREQLEMLNKKIRSGFEQDIDSALKVISVFDSIAGHDTSGLFKTNWVRIAKDPQPEIDSFKKIMFKRDSAITKGIKDSTLSAGIKDSLLAIQTAQKDLIGRISQVAQRLPGLQMIYWTDPNGLQTHKWSVAAWNTPPIPVAQRGYFKNIKEKNSYRYHGKSIFIESIYSYLSGQGYLALSRPSNNSYDSVVVLLAEPHSIFSPVFPPEYGFAIINPSGDVLFHSNKNKNLQENLFEEFANRKALLSGVAGGSGFAFETEYAGEEHQVYLAPMHDLPFYVVSFHDISFISITYAEVLSMAIFFIIVHFIYLIIFSLILDVTTRRATRLRIKEHRFAWLVPKAFKYRAYQLTLAAFLFMILLMLLFVHLMNDTFSCILLVFLASTYATFIFYFNIKRKSGMAIFEKRFLPFTLTAIAFILFINYIAILQDVSSWLLLLLFQGLVLLQVYLLPLFFPVNKWRQHFKLTYRLVLTSWVLLISAVPAYVFFRIAYQSEKTLLLKYHQFEIAERLRQWYDDKKDEPKQDRDTEKSIAFYLLHNEKLQFVSKDSLSENPENPGLSLFEQWFTVGRPRYNDFTARSQNLFADRPEREDFYWYSSGGKISFNYNIYRSADSGRFHGYNLSLASPFPSRTRVFISNDSEDWPINIIFIVILFVVLLLLFSAIRFILKQVFVDTYFEEDDRHKLDKALIVNVQAEQDLHLLLIGLPSSGKSEYVHEALAGTSYYELDIIGLVHQENGWATVVEKIRESGVMTVVIDHFEYYIGNSNIDMEKLKLLERLMHLENKRLIVVSTIHPIEILEGLKAKEIAIKGKDKVEGEITMEADFERYMNMLNNFYKIYAPLKLTDTAELEVDAWDESPLELIKEECRYGRFMHRLQNDLLKEVKKQQKAGIKLKNDEIILKIQSLAKVYYYSLWNSLNKEEKYVLYDVAEDGVVNPKNTEATSRLVSLGLIVHDGALRIMNKSFRNFILTVVNPEEALRMEEELKESSTWSRIRVPLLLVILSVALFLFLTQREAYNQVFTFITAFAAGIPILFRLLAVVPSGKSGGSGNA